MKPTVEIPLTKGFVALIDEEDAPLVVPHKWRAMRSGNNVYAVRMLNWNNGKRPMVMMHRLILGLNNAVLRPDHKDGNGLNNTRANLRIATQSENLHNTALRKDNAQGLKGVGYNKRIERYHARIFISGKARHLGSYRTAEEAHRVYCSAAAEAFGTFARFK